MIYALRSTLHDLRSTIYSQSIYCNLYLHDLPSKLYQLLLPTLCTLRSTIYASLSTLYDLRSMIYALRSVFYDVRSTINALRSMFYDQRSIIYSQRTYCNLYLHNLPSKLYQLLLTLYALRSMLCDLLSMHLLQPLFTRSTL